MINEQTLNVEVKEVSEMHMTYVRHIGPYKGDTVLFARLFTKLFKWAGARELLHFPETKVITVYHDNPDVTDEIKLRTSVCITFPEDTKVEEEDPKEHPKHKHIVDIYMPVKPL